MTHDQASRRRDGTAEDRDRAAEVRDRGADDRDTAAIQEPTTVGYDNLMSAQLLAADDRAESALDRGEAAADRAESALDRGEAAADRAESALDRGEAADAQAESALERVKALGLADLQLQLQEATIHKHQALELNDHIVQGLVMAKNSLDVGDIKKARAAIEGTLVAAQSLISGLVASAGVEFSPGDLILDKPASGLMGHSPPAA